MRFPGKGLILSLEEWLIKLWEYDSMSRINLSRVNLMQKLILIGNHSWMIMLMSRQFCATSKIWVVVFFFKESYRYLI